TTKLQAQRAAIIPALGSGVAPSDADAPEKQAAETVLRHDNLVALVGQTDMIHNWRRNRAPLLKAKDWIWDHLFAAPTEEAQVEGFVGLLEQKLTVTSGEGTVTIGVRLPDAQLAYHLVEAAVQNFLEARHAAEISSIADVISVLETRAAQAQAQLDDALRQLQQLRAVRAEKRGRQVRRIPQARPATPDQETSQLLTQAEGKRRAIADLEAFRQRRITELETRLLEVRALYAESHPAVADVLQSLNALRQGSPQVVTLRRELAALEAELKRRGFLADSQAKGARPAEVALQATALDPTDPREDEDPDIDYAKSQVRHAMNRFNSMLDRVESARIEQDTAQAAFKYRYVVTWPAQRPRGSVEPKPALVLLASLLAGFFLAVMGTTLVDLTSHRIVESWQVTRTLAVPLLAELRLP
ncbi:MAG TPA: hypothetical protein VK454_01720, partial [Myxococcaceae bacterium]|nr:hypothetical protein [Myxococcaceae bacterium]